jgi:hypothetical protein
MEIDINKIPSNEFEFLMDRLDHLEKEVTRYRDIEWKATAFYIAIYTAFINILLDDKKWSVVECYRTGLTLALVCYIILIFLQLLYIHRRLNICRNQRSDVKQSLGKQGDVKIKTLFGLYEGVGFMFFAGFITVLLLLTIFSLNLLWR